MFHNIPFLTKQIMSVANSRIGQWMNSPKANYFWHKAKFYYLSYQLGVTSLLYIDKFCYFFCTSKLLLQQCVEQNKLKSYSSLESKNFCAIKNKRGKLCYIINRCLCRCFCLSLSQLLMIFITIIVVPIQRFASHRAEWVSMISV